MVTIVPRNLSTEDRSRAKGEGLQKLLSQIAPKIEARLRREGLSNPNPVVPDDEEPLSPDDDCPRIADIIREVISGCLDEIVLRGREPACDTAK